MNINKGICYTINLRNVNSKLHTRQQLIIQLDSGPNSNSDSV